MLLYYRDVINKQIYRMNQSGSNHINAKKKKGPSHVTTSQVTTLCLQIFFIENKKFRNTIHITINFEVQKELFIFTLNNLLNIFTK